MKTYENETRARYGNTDAYREHEQKTKNYTKEKWAEANEGLMAIFAEFSACKDSGASPDSVEVQSLVAKLQAHITANYYTCTDEILAGLGKMYVADERFKKNIDKYGEGTAEFVAEAIEFYENSRNEAIPGEVLIINANDFEYQTDKAIWDCLDAFYCV